MPTRPWMVDVEEDSKLEVEELSTCHHRRKGKTQNPFAYTHIHTFTILQQQEKTLIRGGYCSYSYITRSLCTKEYHFRYLSSLTTTRFLNPSTMLHFRISDIVCKCWVQFPRTELWYGNRHRSRAVAISAPGSRQGTRKKLTSEARRAPPYHTA